MLGDSKHTLGTIIPEMESAVQDVEAEIKQLEEEQTKLIESVGRIVGGLSDLRYGRMSNYQLREEVLESLRNLEEACRRKT